MLSRYLEMSPPRNKTSPFMSTLLLHYCKPTPTDEDVFYCYCGRKLTVLQPLVKFCYFNCLFVSDFTNVNQVFFQIWVDGAETHSSVKSKLCLVMLPMTNKSIIEEAVALITLLEIRYI